MGSGDEDDFAGGAGLHYFFVGAGGFGERNLLADHGLQRSVFETGDQAGVDFGDFGGLRSPQREGVNGGAARHQGARGYRDGAAGADNEDAGIGSEQRQ